jgi:hypothetical protein
MGRIRSIAAHTPSIAISVLALIFSLGGGAYAATHIAQHARPAAATNRTISTTVTWHTLTLLNGWASSQSAFGTGNPKVAIQNGVVYLSGSLHQVSGTNDEFAVLPTTDRPTHTLWLPVYTLDGTEGSLEIAASGGMFAFAGSATGFTSLAGVSYPVNS